MLLRSHTTRANSYLGDVGLDDGGQSLHGESRASVWRDGCLAVWLLQLSHAQLDTITTRVSEI
jgi:hypothetical protein